MKRRTRTHKNTEADQQRGCLVIIGGKEDKTGAELRILNKVAELNKGGRLVIATAATEHPAEVFTEYRDTFRKIGVKKIDHLHLETAEDARSEHNLELIRKANTMFFSGGDQLKITTKIGGSPLLDELIELFARGGNIAGTSAGAAIMGDNMLLGGSSMDTTESHKVGNWMMAPGLGLVKNIIIDQHFGQRARIGRLLGAVAFNPRILGIGIDEDTSILVHDKEIEVLGSNAVYVIDGHDVTYTNIAESAADRTMSLFDVRLHILSDGDRFDLVGRKPRLCEEAEQRVRKHHREAERAARH